MGSPDSRATTPRDIRVLHHPHETEFSLPPSNCVPGTTSICSKSSFPYLKMTDLDQICSSQFCLRIRKCRGTGRGNAVIPGPTPELLTQNPDIGIWNFQKFPQMFFCKPNVKARTRIILNAHLGRRFHEPVRGIF